MSASYLSPYNREVDFTPQLARFSKGSIVFKRHQTEAGHSGTAYASLFSGVDALEISGGTIPTVFWAVVAPAGTPLALNAEFAEAIKQVVDVPVICVGRINSPQLAEFVLETGRADLVSMGRALHADSELPNKAAAGRLEDIAPCVGCNIGCIGSVVQGGPATCIVNSASGREREMAIPTSRV